MISLADSKVTGPETIKGAKVGVAGLPFDDAVLKTIRDSQGLSEDDVQAVNVGFNLEPALLSGKVDAVIGAYFNIEATSIEIKDGAPPNVISMEALGVPTYDELLIVANSERLADDPAFADAVSRFITGLKQGVEGAIADEPGSVTLMEENADYSSEEIQGMVPDTLALLTPPDGRTITCFDLDNWQALGDWMVEKAFSRRPSTSARSRRTTTTRTAVRSRRRRHPNRRGRTRPAPTRSGVAGSRTRPGRSRTPRRAHAPRFAIFRSRAGAGDIPCCGREPCSVEEHTAGSRRRWSGRTTRSVIHASAVGQLSRARTTSPAAPTRSPSSAATNTDVFGSAR